MAPSLNTLDGKTTVAIPLGNITTPHGCCTDLNTAHAANGSSITGLGNEAATLSDTTHTLPFSTYSTAIHPAPLTPIPSPPSPAQQQTSTLLTPQPASAISAMRPSPSPTPPPTDLNTLDGNTTGPSTRAPSPRLRRRRTSATLLRTPPNRTASHHEAPRPGTPNDLERVSVLNTLDGNTTGTVDAGTVTTVSGIL